jgi:tetratricopeptide (TPR) repeat protein
MRANVLPDARLAKLAGRAVRLDIDTEKPGNAPFVERFPIDAWPTLLAIDPATEQVLLRWAGTATVAEVEKLVLDAERALRAGRASRADEALARADRVMGERRHADAAAAYREALVAGGKGWERRDRAAEALVQAAGFAGDAAACVAASREVLPALAPGARSARVAAQGLTCALELDDEPARAEALDALEPLARSALAAPGVLADDRSWLYDELSEARASRGDAAGAKALAARWLRFLDGEASRARTPLARSAFDGPRLNAAIRAGEPARVLPALLASERDLPDEFVPPTNLGVLYLELDRPKDALAAADRALARAQGPRRIRVLVLRAQAQDALGDRAAARATLERALSEAAALPDATRPRGYTAKARQLLDGMGGAAE